MPSQLRHKVPLWFFITKKKLSDFRQGLSSYLVSTHRDSKVGDQTILIVCIDPTHQYGQHSSRAEMAPNLRNVRRVVLSHVFVGQQLVTVAVSRGYDTCYDGSCQLLKSTGSGWNTLRVSIDRVDLCQTHCKQVPDFSRTLVPAFVNMAIVFQVCSLYIPIMGRLPFEEPVSGSP